MSHTTTHEGKVTIPQAYVKNEDAVSYTQQLLEAFANMDCVALAQLIPEDAAFEDTANLWGFLAKYHELFEEEKICLGAKLVLPLRAIKGACYGCKWRDGNENVDLEAGECRSTYCFVSTTPKYRSHFNIIIEYRSDGTVKDMYRCHGASHHTLPEQTEEDIFDFEKEIEWWYNYDKNISFSSE